MAKKQEDIVFKDVTEKEVDIFLKRLNIKSKKKKLNPTEIRFIDAATLVADIIIELDDIILIIEFQSTAVDNDDGDRFLAYYSVVNFKKEIDKEVKLVVVSTAEKTKKITHEIGDTIMFSFNLYSMRDEDGDAIINNIETKIENNEEITTEELIDLSLVPVMGSENSIETQIEKSVNLILNIDLEQYEIRNLVKSVAYLLADKFLEESDKKTAICDALGGKMNAVYNYGERRKEEGIKEGIKEENKNIAIKMLKNNEDIEKIKKYTNITDKEITQLKNEIKNKNI